MNIPSIVVAVAATLAAPAWSAAQDYHREAGEDFGSPLHPFLTVRAGGWVCSDFEFHATSNKGLRTIKGNALLDTGAELGAVLFNDFSVSASVDLATSQDVTMGVAGVNVGYYFPFESLGFADAPVRARVSVGGLWGDVRVKGFSDFDNSVGYRAGIDFSSDIPGTGVAIDAFLDFRIIQFDLKEDVNAGDTNYGGKGFVLGAGITLKI